MPDMMQLNSLRRMTWRDFFEERRSLDFDTFVFLPKDFSWRDDEEILISAEDVYEDQEVSECDTPIPLFDQGFRFGFTISEVRTAYDDAWLYLGGPGSIGAFNRCLQHYLDFDSLLMP